jgi:hypothetical protein
LLVFVFSLKTVLDEFILLLFTLFIVKLSSDMILLMGLLMTLGCEELPALALADLAGLV